MSSQETIRVLYSLPWRNRDDMVTVLSAAITSDFGNAVFGVKDLELLTDVLLQSAERAQKVTEADTLRHVCDEFLLKQAAVIENQFKAVDELRQVCVTLAGVIPATRAPLSDRLYAEQPPVSPLLPSAPPSSIPSRVMTPDAGGGRLETTASGLPTHLPPAAWTEHRDTGADRSRPLHPPHPAQSHGDRGTSPFRDRQPQAGRAVQLNFPSPMAHPSAHPPHPAASPINDTLQNLIHFTQRSRSMLPSNSPSQNFNSQAPLFC